MTQHAKHSQSRSSLSTQNVALYLEAELLKVPLYVLDPVCTLLSLLHDRIGDLLLHAADRRHQSTMALHALLSLSLNHLLGLQDLFAEVCHHKGHYFVSPSFLMLHLVANLLYLSQNLIPCLLPACLELGAQNCHSFCFNRAILLFQSLQKIFPDWSHLLTLLSHLLRDFSLEGGGSLIRIFPITLNVFSQIPCLLLQNLHL